MRDRYSVIVGLLFVAVVIIAFLHTISANNPGTLGLEKLPARWPLPEFAVPAAASALEGEANVAQDDCETTQVPCPAGARRTPACQIHVAGAIRVCDLFDRPLVLSFWFTKGSDCADQQDAVQSVFERYRGRVSFLSLDVGDERGTVRELIRQHHWKMPVGYDREGVVSELYRVGGCPTFAYVYPGGTLQSASIGDLTSSQLESNVRELLRATRTAERG
jgi:hypothetical protein